MFLGQEVHYYMVYIAYFTELNLQICDHAEKNNAFDAKIVNTLLTKIFIAIFAPDERLPSSATLLSSTTITIIADMADWNVLFFQKLNHLSLEAMDCHSVMLQTVAKDTGRHMF